MCNFGQNNVKRIYEKIWGRAPRYMWWINRKIHNDKNGKNEKVFESMINAIKLTKYIDEIIKIKKENPKPKINFDDMLIFNKKDNKRIDIESLLTKKINPSFKYYIIKNLPL